MKQCSYYGCRNKVFSHGYCFYHQNNRTDKQWLSRKNVIINSADYHPIRKITPKKAKEKEKDNIIMVCQFHHDAFHSANRSEALQNHINITEKYFIEKGLLHS